MGATKQSKCLENDLRRRGLILGTEKYYRIDGDTTGGGISELTLHIGRVFADNAIEADYFGTKTVKSREVCARIDKSTGAVLEVIYVNEEIESR